MEIDITSFFESADAFEFSASRAERGQNAGPETWANALEEGASSPLLTTEAQLEALRSHMRGYGAWEKSEIEAWSPTECNALFIQLISGDMRESGLDQIEIDDDKAWRDYEKGAEDGRYSGSIYRGDDGRVYYYLGD